MLKRVILTLALATTLFANEDPCCNWWCGDLGLGLDYLYWKPMHCPFHYASEITMFEATGSPARDEKRVYEVKADYDSGFRVHADYELCCSFLNVSYLFYRSSERRHREPERGGTASPNVFVPTNIPLGSAGGANPLSFAFVEGSMRFTYQNVDVRYGQFLHRMCGCNIYTFGNLRYVDLERKDAVNGVDIDTENPNWRFERKSEFQGLGFGVGLGGNFHICNGFIATGELNTMGIIGNLKTPTDVVNEAATPAELRTKYPSPTCIIPALDFRLALNYQLCCPCVIIDLEVGYEVNYYWGPLAFADDRAYPTVDITTASGAEILEINDTRVCHDIGFAGPYFGITLIF